MRELKYYMWGFQHIFQYRIESEIREIFNILSNKLNPDIFLLGILKFSYKVVKEKIKLISNEINSFKLKQLLAYSEISRELLRELNFSNVETEIILNNCILIKESKGWKPICLEPEDCGIEVDKFEHVAQLAIELYDNDPQKNIFHSDPYDDARYHEGLKNKNLRKAVKQILNQHFSHLNKLSFVSYPVILGNYEIFVILQFDKEIYSSFYALQKSYISRDVYKEKRVLRSLMEALIDVVLYEAIELLYKPYPGDSFLMLEKSCNEILRMAASKFLSSIISINYPRGYYYFFKLCNFISSLKYEGGSTIGKLLIARSDHPSINIPIKLKEPVRLHDSLDTYRRIRKLLEIATDKLYLYTDGEVILGFAELINDYDTNREDLFIVNFLDFYKWEFIHGNNKMMTVEYTIPRLPRPKFEQETFKSTLRRIFIDIQVEAIELLWNIVNIATEQKHGTLIIISKDARHEAERLKKQSTTVEPIKSVDNFVKLITSIDGAVLLGPAGNCYAIGVILDGLANEKGNAGRGARYNSAIRYIEMKKNEAVAIIISEDGMIDLYPQLRLQIKRSEIYKHLQALKDHVELPEVDYDDYRPIMNWFDHHRFYLSKEICDEINKLRDRFNSKLNQEVGRIYFDYSDFKPHPEIDDSYFIDETE